MIKLARVEAPYQTAYLLFETAMILTSEAAVASTMISFFRLSEKPANMAVPPERIVLFVRSFLT